MTKVRAVAVATLAGLMCVVGAAPARADITAFIGANTTPVNRQTRGFSAGAGFLIIAFEIEYADTTDDRTAREPVPSLKTGSGNVLLQTPIAFFRVQPYVTTGAGFYSETLGTRTDRGFGYNTGGGVKIALVGPLRVRLDYRVFKLGSGALFSPAHRVYVGLNLKF